MTDLTAPFTNFTWSNLTNFFADFLWDDVLVSYTEYFLWNYVQKYFALTFCDYESKINSTSNCWQYAWIFRPVWLLFWSVLWCGFWIFVFLGWMTTKTLFELFGLP